MAFQIASEIVRQPVQWLWEPWLPAGKLVILDGDPGLGKSTLTCELAARFSRADQPSATLMVGAEDDAASTVVPRLAAAGADLSRVRVWDAAAPPRFPADTPQLRAAIMAVGARLAVIDPLSACLERGASPNTDHTVRQALTPLAAVAAETGCAILLLRHLRKRAGGPAIHRGLGSVGIVAAARVAWLLGKHPYHPDMRLLTMTKSNLGPVPPAKAFVLLGGRVMWQDDEEELTADDVGRAVKTTAEDWLATILEKHCRPSDEVLAEAVAAGISERTLYRARAAHFVVARRFQKTLYWCLPGQDPATRFNGLPPLFDLKSELA